jgi:sterol-4alpha-carboxylate 3-dehydrogenase (decarboxylating)
MGAEIYKKVNVIGTQTVIDACLSHNVPKLVYTSSAGVVYNGTQNLVDVDERMAIPTVPLDAYNETKAQAEKLVLEANGKGGFLKTCALRPAGIFGEGDRQLLMGLKQVMENGQTKFQIGDNENLFDWTYVGNVAHAHLLASDRLEKVVSPYEFTFPLSDVNKSTGDYRVPTSEARPLGPITNPTEEEKKAAKRFEEPKRLDDEDDNDLQPVLRTKMDQFAKATDPEYADTQDKEAAVTNKYVEQGEKAVSTISTPIDPELRVAGQAYFITNGEPSYFWDFHRTVWSLGMNHVAPYKIKMPPAIGMLLATLAEGWSWLTGREAGFTRFRVRFATQKRYYNTERARRLLGYEPIWGVEEGLKKTLVVS